MEKINKQRNVDWKGLKTSSSAFPVAASYISTPAENSLLVLKNLMSLLRTGISQLALARVFGMDEVQICFPNSYYR